MLFCDAVELLGRKVGVELSASDGVCRIDVDGMDVAIHEVEEIDGFCLLGEIGDLPPLNTEPVMNALLVANHLFKGTGGATISRDPDTGKLFLCRIRECGVFLTFVSFLCGEHSFKLAFVSL